MSSSLDQLEEMLQRAEREAGGLPPVESWHPPLSGDIDIRILADGRWLHEGSEFKRLSLVKLFSSILRIEEGEYFLVTPVEKWRIQVDDAPFHAASLTCIGEGAERAIAFTLNTGDTVIVDQAHPIMVESAPQGPRPYLGVRNGLRALIGRSAFYEMVELAEERSGELVIQSRGKSFSLGKL